MHSQGQKELILGGIRIAFNSHGSRRPVLYPAIFALTFFLSIFILSGTALAASTKIISTTATGGDCASIGTWDAATKTCTLTSDVTAPAGNNGIEIISDGVTLDGAGHAVYGSGGNATGGSLSVHNNVTIRNLTISGFSYGIFLQASNTNRLHDNTITGNITGIYLVVSNNNRIYNNNFNGNTTQAMVSSGSGNLFDMAGSGGNYWSSFDTPDEGCMDDNGDYVCDASFNFSGGLDHSPWSSPNAWRVTPPEDTTPPAISSVLPAGTVSSGSATIKVYYSDSGGSINTASLAVYLDGILLNGCSANQSVASCAVYGLTLGAHTINGSVADNHGNVAGFSGSFSFVDSVAPVVSNILPTGTHATDSATIIAYFSDGTGSGIDSSTAAVYLDGVRLGSCSPTSANIICNVSGLADGMHAIIVSVADLSGNTGSGSGSFGTDQTSPVISSVTPSGTIAASAADIVVSYSDNLAGVDTSAVSVTMDGAALAGCNVTAASASCHVYGLATGVHAIGGSVMDHAGNSRTINGSFTFSDTAAPVFTSIQPSGTINTASAAVVAYYTDSAGSGIDSASVTVYLDSTPVSGCSANAERVSCSVSGLANGSHTLALSVSDLAGNRGNGTRTFIVDTSAPEITPARYIRDNATGGDCATIGVWDQYSKTCTLTKDLTFAGNGIEILSNGVTLDGAGHTITGADAMTTGGSVSLRSNITIKNLKIKNFGYGIYLMSSNNNTIAGNFLQGNKTGIILTNSSNNKIYRNNFVGNTTQASVSGGSGNLFDLALPNGGNYWDDFDTPAEGCSDAAGDGFCDAAHLVYGAQDNLAWAAQYGWTGTPPPVVKPAMSIRVTGAFWGSYADYLARDLSVRISISNNHTSGVQNVQLTGSANSAGVSITTPLPLGIGNIAAGSSVQSVLHYHIPVGVTRWQASYTAAAQDAAGNTFTYP